MGRKIGSSTNALVKVENADGRLRLRWTCQCKRYALTVGLPDSKTNRSVAVGKANQIVLDIISGHFDPTLKNYKPQAAIARTQLSVAQTLERFWKDKQKGVCARTYQNYHAAVVALEVFFGSDTVLIQTILLSNAEKFLEWLREQDLEDTTRKTYLTLLKAIWDWAFQQGLVEANPWERLVKRIKVAPKQARPFTREEIGAILACFKSDRYYRHYADFVEFLFGTGCRTGEAIGLRWKHLNEDCSTVWIGESLSRGVRKSTKTNRARTIALTPNLQEMLLIRKPKNFDPDTLVFTSPKDKAIDDHNFRNRAWKTILTRLEIEYRKPYTTRHTLVSHALDLGYAPATVAELTGHSTRVIYHNYAGNVNSKAKLPEVLRDD